MSSDQGRDGGAAESGVDAALSAFVSSPQVFRRLFDDSPALVYIKDRQNRFVFANAKICRFFGRERDEVLGHTTHELLPAEVADGHVANDRQVLEQGAALEFEETTLQGDGTHYYRSLKFPVRSETGEVVAVGGISTDITEERRREDAAVLDRETVLSLLNAITESAFLMSTDGTLLAVNQTVAERYGLPPEEMVSKSIYDLLPPDVAAARGAQVRRVVETGEPVRFEDERDGMRILNAVYPVRSGGPLQQLAVFGYDITELRDVQRRMQESEADFRLLAENASDVVFKADTDGRFVWVSPSVTAVLGWESDGLIGRTFLDMVHPDDRAAVLKVRREIGAGLAGRYEARIMAAGGDYRWMAVTVRQLESQDGAIVRVGSWRDIHDEVDARQAHEVSEQRFRVLTEVSPDYIFIIDRTTRVQYVNPTVELAFGRPAEELVGLPLNELFSLEAAERMAAGIAEVFATGKRRHSEMPLAGPWGDAWLSTWMVPIVDESGAVAQVFGVSRDVTGMKQTERDLAELNADLERRVEQRTAQLEATNEELKAFAYSVSHDLRGPLRAVDGFSQIVLEDSAGCLDDDGVANLERVRSAAQHMAQLIEALLTLSRLSFRDLDLQTVDLSALAATTVDQLREQDPDRRVRATIATGCLAVADRELVALALTNLLGNAWKFTSKRDEAHIEFGATEVDGERAFFVRDDGAGFDPEAAGKLFQPFQRLHGEAEYPGTGIGLATVRRILTRLGGLCWAEGEPGRGATFYFTLPETGEAEEGTRAVAAG